MSWLFSQALAEEYSPENLSDGEPSAQLNVMPTQQPFWRNDKTTDICRLSRYGVTFSVLTLEHGEALLRSFLAVSRAKISAQPVAAQASQENDPDYGQRCNNRPYPGKKSGYGLATAVKLLPTPRSSDATRGDCPSERNRRSPSLVSAAKTFPTPMASDAKDRGNLSSPCIKRRVDIGKQVALSMQVSHESGRLNPEWVEWLACRVDRIKALGNGQVPRVASVAYTILSR